MAASPRSARCCISDISDLRLPTGRWDPRQVNIEDSLSIVFQSQERHGLRSKQHSRRSEAIRAKDIEAASSVLQSPAAEALPVTYLLRAALSVTQPQVREQPRQYLAGGMGRDNENKS